MAILATDHPPTSIIAVPDRGDPSRRLRHPVIPSRTTEIGLASGFGHAAKEEAMRSTMGMLAALAIGLAVPAVAQQTTTTDPQIQKEAAVIVARFTEVTNKGDTQALGELFTNDAILIDVYGRHTTREAIQDSRRNVHSMGLTVTTKVEDVQSVFGGQGMLCVASYTGSYRNNPLASQVHGNEMFVLEKTGDDWKIVGLTVSRQ